MKKIKTIKKITIVLSLLTVLSCQDEDLPKANFDTSAVAEVSVKLSHERAVLEWTTPVKDTPNGYRVSWSPGSGLVNLPADETSHEILGLEVDNSYVISVQSLYDHGVSGKKSVSAQIPDEINLLAFPGSGFVQLQWERPNRDDLTGYVLTSDVLSEDVELGVDVTSYVVPDLENDTSYSFSLTPKYEEGLGASIAKSATPGFVEMIVVSDALVNVGEELQFSYNPAFLLNQEVSSFQWELGDGTTADLQNVIHTYETAGEIEVRLEITAPSGETFSSTKVIDVIGIHWAFDASSHIKGITALRTDDGSLYIGDSAGTFYALNSDGTQKWSLSLTTESGSQELYDGSPALGSDGTIYVTSQNGNLYAISQSGTINWTFTTNNSADIRVGAAIATDGTIYINDREGHFYAVNPDGSLKWSFAHAGGGNSNPAIASDGTIYFGSNDDNLYALNPDGTVKWNYTTGGNVDSSPSIGADGTIYFGAADNMFYAVNPEGGLNWSYDFGSQRTMGAPAIGTDGTIYVGVRDNKLYAFNSGGSLSWSTEFTKRFIFASATLDANGNLYMGNDDGNLYALAQDTGEILWEVQTGRIFSSPTIGEDGNIYVGTLIDSNVAPSARFLSVYGAADALADSPWPTKRGNKNQTGRNP